MKNLLIVDLEATCFPRGEEPTGFVSEIIEIGAVIFDIAARRITREFQAFVRPALFPALSPYCVQLTGIQQADVDAGPPLDTALSRLTVSVLRLSPSASVPRTPATNGAWLYTPADTVFSSWGFYDQRQIERECARRGIPYPFAKDHISLKHNHASFYGLKHPLGMDAALAYHHLPLLGSHHRALDDARNIAAIAACMLDDGWTHRRLTA